MRNCIPFDFGPSRRIKDGVDRYHFWDLDSEEGPHNLSLVAEDIVEIARLEIVFDPAQYVTWTPTNWIVARDWGANS